MRFKNEGTLPMIYPRHRSTNAGLINILHVPWLMLCAIPIFEHKSVCDLNILPKHPNTQRPEIHKFSSLCAVIFAKSASAQRNMTSSAKRVSLRILLERVSAHR